MEPKQPEQPKKDEGLELYEWFRSEPGSPAREKEEKFLKSVGVIGALIDKSRLEKAIENLQDALNPVVATGRITGEQVEEQISRYRAAVAEYNAAWEEVREETLKTGPRPEFVKRAAQYLDDEWRELLTAEGFQPSTVEGEEVWRHPDSDLDILIDHHDNGDPLWVALSDDEMVGGSDATRAEESTADLADLITMHKGWLEQERKKPLTEEEIKKRTEMTEADKAELKRMGIIGRKRPRSNPFEGYKGKTFEEQLKSKPREPEEQYVVMKDRTVKTDPMSYNQCLGWMQRYLPYSWDHAFKHEGYSVVPYERGDEPGKPRPGFTEKDKALLKGMGIVGSKLADDARKIRTVLQQGGKVLAVDARDGREFPVDFATLRKGVLFGQEPRMGIMFPIKSWRIASKKTAGQWGARSYDSDQVHDILDRYRRKSSMGGRGFDEPIPEQELSKLHRYVGETLGEYRQSADDDAAYLGVVVFLLTHGSSVPFVLRDRAIEIAERMLGDEDYLLSWKGPAERKNALQKELALLKRDVKKRAWGGWHRVSMSTVESDDKRFTVTIIDPTRRYKWFLLKDTQTGVSYEMPTMTEAKQKAKDIRERAEEPKTANDDLSFAQEIDNPFCTCTHYFNDHEGGKYCDHCDCTGFDPAPIEKQVEWLMSRRAFGEESTGRGWAEYSRNTEYEGDGVWVRVYFKGGKVDKAELWTGDRRGEPEVKQGWDGVFSVTQTYGD